MSRRNIVVRIPVLLRGDESDPPLVGKQSNLEENKLEFMSAIPVRNRSSDLSDRSYDSMRRFVVRQGFILPLERGHGG